MMTDLDLLAVKCFAWGDLSQVNLPELRYTIDTIKEDPASWYQADWAWEWTDHTEVPHEVFEQCEAQGVEVPLCGTAYCLAGHVAVANGCSFDADTSMFLMIVPDALRNELRTANPHCVQFSVQTIATHILRLNHRQAEWLFAADRTIEEFEKFYAAALEQQGGTR